MRNRLLIFGILLLLLIPLSLATRNDFYKDSLFGVPLTVQGDLTCGRFDQPHLGPVIVDVSNLPTSGGLPITCGRDPNTALIDIYLISDSGLSIWSEQRNPYTIPQTDIQAVRANPYWKKLQYECYFCNIPGTPQPGITTCSSASDCPGGYVCELNSCKRNCDATWGPCVNDQQQGTRPSGCSDLNPVRDCNSDKPAPPNTQNNILQWVSQLFQSSNLIWILLIVFGGLLLLKFFKRKR